MGDRKPLRRTRKGKEMNIAKVKEALADAKKEKQHAEADGNSDYAYWQGYEDGIFMALWHIEGAELFQIKEKSK